MHQQMVQAPRRGLAMYLVHDLSYESQKILAREAGLARPRPLSPLYPMISYKLQRFFSRAVADRGSDLPGLAKATSARIERVLQIGAAIEP